MSSFEILCLPNRSDLLGLAVNLTKNKADAEDLLQQTFQLALVNWSSFRALDDEHVALQARAWLFCIMRNRFTSNYRRNKNKKRYQNEMQHLILEGTFGKRETDEVQPPLEREYIELDDTVKNAFALLPETQRVVMQRFADGEQYHEIAASLGIPIGTVMSRLFRARKTLSSSLSSYAEKEYGFTFDVKKKAIAPKKLEVETTESPQTEPTRVQSIMSSDYDTPLFVR